jgi:hypothetical protein
VSAWILTWKEKNKDNQETEWIDLWNDTIKGIFFLFRPTDGVSDSAQKNHTEWTKHQDSQQLKKILVLFDHLVQNMIAHFDSKSGEKKPTEHEISVLDMLKRFHKELGLVSKGNKKCIQKEMADECKYKKKVVLEFERLCARLIDIQNQYIHMFRTTSEKLTQKRSHFLIESKKKQNDAQSNWFRKSELYIHMKRDEWDRLADKSTQTAQNVDEVERVRNLIYQQSESMIQNHEYMILAEWMVKNQNKFSNQ